MKIDAKSLLSFLKKFQFTNRIEEIVLEERDGKLAVYARDSDLLVFGVYDEEWYQEQECGVSIKKLSMFLSKQDELDINFSHRMVMKGKGTLEYKYINPIYVSTKPNISADLFGIVELYSNRVFISKDDKALIQSLLASTSAEKVSFTSEGLYAGDETDNIIKFPLETNLDKDVVISCKKETFSEVLKKHQEVNIKFAKEYTRDVEGPAILISSDDVFYAIEVEVD